MRNANNLLVAKNFRTCIVAKSSSRICALRRGTQDAPGGAGGSRSRAMTRAVAFEVQQLGNTIKTLYHLLNNHHYAANKVGSETSKALKRGATQRCWRPCTRRI